MDFLGFKRFFVNGSRLSINCLHQFLWIFLITYTKLQPQCDLISTIKILSKIAP